MLHSKCFRYIVPTHSYHEADTYYPRQVFVYAKLKKTPDMNKININTRRQLKLFRETVSHFFPKKSRKYLVMSE